MTETDFPTAPVKLSILSTPDHLPVVRAALERLCALIGFDEASVGDVVLAVDEALTNVIRHAYDGRADRPIEVTLRPLSPGESPRLEIRLRDWGRQTDLARIKSRDLDEIRPGGLGVHIMKRCMDSVRYDHVPDGGTLLTMVKALPARSKP